MKSLLKMKRISVDVERERAEEEHVRFMECGGTTSCVKSIEEERHGESCRTASSVGDSSVRSWVTEKWAGVNKGVKSGCLEEVLFVSFLGCH